MSRPPPRTLCPAWVESSRAASGLPVRPLVPSPVPSVPLSYALSYEVEETGGTPALAGMIMLVDGPPEEECDCSAGKGGGVGGGPPGFAACAGGNHSGSGFHRDLFVRLLKK